MKNLEIIKIENKQAYCEALLGSEIEQSINEAFELLSDDINAVSFNFNGIKLVIRKNKWIDFTPEDYYTYYKVALISHDNPTQVEQDKRDFEKEQKELLYKANKEYYKSLVPFIPNNPEYHEEKAKSNEWRFLFNLAELVYGKSEDDESRIYEAVSGISGFQQSLIQQIIQDYFPSLK